MKETAIAVDLVIVVTAVFGAIYLTNEFGDVMPATELRSTRPSSPKFTKSEIESAALKIVWPLPRCQESWIGGTIEQCDAAKGRLDQKRREFSSFEPVWMRPAIEKWFDHAERDIARTREDCVTQKSAKSQQEYREKMARESERTQEVLRSIGR